ncbi:MAG: multidrug ABC transporter permease [Deltaproteobacteria bacterium]|nr:multidrug ABC transporter permease [Deltaproteobacteria bacterium]
MSDLWRKTSTLLSVYFAYMTQYRVELWLWALASTLPLLSMGAWMNAADVGIVNLDAATVGRYFLSVFVVRQMTVVWVIWDVEEDLHDGNLSHHLLQPMDPVWRHIAGHVSERAARLPFTAVLICFFALLVEEVRFIPTLANLGRFTIALGVVFVFRFLVQHTFSMFSFWTERSHAIEGLWNLPYLFLSGMLAPLEAFPQNVRDIVEWTPFPMMVAVPANVLLGRDVDYSQALLVFLLWGVPFLVLNRVLWRLGLKRFSAMGA